MRARPRRPTRPRTLWGHGVALDRAVLDYTASGDRACDARLLVWDIYGTMAHVEGLWAIGVLSRGERSRLLAGLRRALVEARSGAFAVTEHDEDVHTALERYLVRRLGVVGEKVHTGRSRNDQVLADLRLHAKDRLLAVALAVLDASAALERLAAAERRTVWPGYTHQRRAMPSTVGLWAAGFAESLLDDLRLVETAFELVDRSPLGSAAGFGVPLPLDRETVAARLGFASVQRNVTAVQASRGKLDVVILSALWAVAHDLGRFAWDVILFSAEEFGYLRLPARLATGSSIMPHKQNPDLFELTRAREAVLAGRLAEATALCGKLPSGYHRDLQLLKPALLSGLDTAHEMAVMMAAALPLIEVDRERCAAALAGGVLAADDAYRRVRLGIPFRRAYRQVAAEIARGTFVPTFSPAEILRARRHTGGAGSLGLGELRRRIARTRRLWLSRRRSFARALDRLTRRR